jgi:hypothetical protein
MKLISHFLPASLALVVSLSSCNSFDCTNNNPVLASQPYYSKEYKNELARLMQTEGLESLSYFINSYVEDSTGKYLIVDVEGDSVCAQLALEIGGEECFDNLRRVKGMSYSGAQLSGLEIEVEKSHDSIMFIYSDLKRILD